jgi:hypothetical protein
MYYDEHREVCRSELDLYYFSGKSLQRNWLMENTA